MKKIILSIFSLALLLSACTDNGKAVEARTAQKVALDTSEKAVIYTKVKPESHVKWRASHLGGVQKRFGRVSLSDAKVTLSNKEISSAKVRIDMASLSVENFEDQESQNKLKGHLASDDFFKTSTYPTSSFELTNISKTKGNFNSIVSGNLTILDATKSITFKANVSVSDNEISIKSEDFSVDRREWGLSYNTEGTAGVPVDYLIANNIGFTIDVAIGR